MNETNPSGAAIEPGKIQPGQQPIPMGYFVPLNPPKNQDEINLLDWLQILAKHKRLIIVAAFLCAFVAGVISLVMTPIYRADAVLAPAQEAEDTNGLQALAGQFGGLANFAGISIPNNGGVDMSLVTLQSRRFIDGFVNEQKIKPILFEDRWDNQAAAWIEESSSIVTFVKTLLIRGGSARPASGLAPGEPSLLETYKLFTEEVLSVSKDPETGVVIVGIAWKDPVIAAEWVNALVDRLNAEIRQEAIDESERSIGYLNEQIENTNLAGLQTVMYRLIEEHTKNMTLARANDDYALKIIDPAVVPEEIARPNRRVMVLLGFVAGFLLGVLAAFRRNFVQREIVT